MNVIQICDFLRTTGGLAVDARLFSVLDLVTIAQAAASANRMLVIRSAGVLSGLALTNVSKAGGSNVVYGLCRRFRKGFVRN